jgi:AcrR family transcriptional regulator
MDDKHGNFLLRVYELYNRFGIKSVTMDDVAHELGISKKTLYECIADKTELVKHVMEMVFRYHNEKLEEITSRGLNAIEELFEVNNYMSRMVKDQNPTLGYDLQKYYPELFKSMADEQRTRMREAIQKNLLKGQAEGLYREEMNVAIIANLHMTRMEYRYRHNTYQDDEFDSREVMQEIFIYHLRGIANEKGIKILNEKLKTEWK